MQFGIIYKWAMLAATAGLLAGCQGSGSDGSGSAGGSGSTGGGASGEDFVVGVAAPFTGNSSEFGVQIRMGVELFQEELNNAGGVNGRKLKLNQQDDGGKAEQAQNVATALAGDDSVLAVVGHFNSSCSLAGKPIYTQAKLPMFSPASTNVDVTKDSEFMFRNIFTDAFQGQSLAQYAGQVLGVKNVAILFDNDDYGAGLKESFKGEASKLGVNVVIELPYNKETPDFKSQLTTLQGASTKPDLILVAGLYTEAANIARQARDLGIQTQLIAGDGVFSQQYITLAGQAAEGTFVTCPFLFDLGGERATKFAEAFKKKYNKEPDAWAALSYDAISMIVDGIKKNGFTREGVQTYLKSINSPETAYDGLSGKTFFDEEGDSKKPVQVAVVKGGKFVAAEKQLSVGGGAPAAGTAPAGSAPAGTPAAAAAPAGDAGTTTP